MENRILDNFKYYKLLLSEANLLGKTTKLSFIKLYDNLKLKINETINEQIEDILFDLNIFYRSNIDSFKNKYFNFILGKDNNVNIYKINEFIDDISKEINFNKTLNNITDSIFNSIVSKNIMDVINNKLYHKIEELFNNIDFVKNEMNNILNTIEEKDLPNDMNNTLSIISNYNDLYNDQQMKFRFIVSDKPFLFISNFIHNYLEPPLIQIKEKYNLIEVEILNLVNEKLNKFPDYSLNVKNNLDLDNKISNITETINIFKNYLSDYFIYFMKDISEYFNQLAYFTIINGSNYLESQCNLSICSINFKRK